jgi:hypothetical protein
VIASPLTLGGYLVRKLVDNWPHLRRTGQLAK